MSAVDEAREALITLQVEQDREAERLKEANLALAQAMSDQMESERYFQQRRSEIAKARKELERQEKLAEARRQADQVEDDVERLRAKFARRAAGHVWFEGTGNNDSILPHQWQAVMFGAVARRWILGDGVGLGKTRTAVGWLDIIESKKVIIVCEANICAQFAGEVIELAPHREVIQLAKRSPQARHELLDYILTLDEATVVVNFEMWRRDKDALAKLVSWQADTLIVDEAHNLKSTATKNYEYIKMLLMIDNTCARCKGLIKGLYDPAELRKKPSRKVPMPCPTCGWTKGEQTPTRYANQLEELLSTKSIQNVCFTTGTPILNDPTDLYSLLHLSNPVLFNTKQSFQTTYLSQNFQSGKWDFREGAMANLKPLIEGLFLARTLEDTGVELPTQHRNVIPIELDKESYPKQWKAIRELTEAGMLQLESGETMTVMALIALITRKRQANVWPGGIIMHDEDGEVIFDAGEIDESVKMDVIIDNMLSMHELGHRQIVFSQFKTGLAELEKRVAAKGLRVVRFDGDTPDALRTEVKLNFNRANHEEAKWDVVLANYKTGGTGLNFTEATVTHIMDEEWNPGKRDQGYGRTKRIGQTEETHVFVYRIRKSIDTWMANTIQRKETMISGFNETMVGSKNDDLATDLKEAMKTGEML
jgi:SNF2 family DNA or RNA helicase